MALKKQGCQVKVVSPVPFAAFPLSIFQPEKTKGIEYNIKALASLIKKHNNLFYYIIGAGEEEAYLKGLVLNF